MPRRCMTKRAPFLYQRRDQKPPPVVQRRTVKHRLRVNDMVQVKQTGYISWIEELLPDGYYWVGCPTMGYDVYRDRDLRLLHRDTLADKVARYVYVRGWRTPLKRHGVKKRIRIAGRPYPVTLRVSAPHCRVR